MSCLIGWLVWGGRGGRVIKKKGASGIGMKGGR